MSEKMKVSDRPFTLTRAEAATRQVEAAIEAMMRGRFDVAITLAGAAEDMINREGSLFAFQQAKAKELGIDGKELSDHMNAQRNWLKHNRPPDSMDFTLYDAGFMVARAVTKLEPESCTLPIAAFCHWWTANINTLTK
jgi:hypothetical protein